jgi:subtilase family serine protease
LYTSALLLALTFPFAMRAQSARSRVMITGPVNENVLHRLAGNTRSQANAQNDAGRVADDLSLEHMILQLKRPPEQEEAIQQFIQSQQDPSSPNYHRWLIAEEMGTNFGPAQEDLDTVTGWLTSHGFTVNSVHPTGMTIDFSGTAGQVRTAFHTEIHNLNVNGVAHIGNMSDPMIAEALAPVVEGVVSLHDFMPHAYSKPRANYTFSSSSGKQYAVVPADLATIYNMTPVFSKGFTGSGQTIAVVEDSDMYSSADWTTFRKTFGLSTAYPNGTLTTVHPAGTGSNNCTDPGVNSDDIETELDAEWASAAAPSAAIQVATCADTRTTFGGLIAVLNLLTAASKPNIISMSYGECEAENGATANAAYNSAFQAATAAGISVFVAAGDEGAASCDAGATGATHGIGISGFAVSQYDVAVGGTDFSDTYSGTVSSYWGATNSPTYGSAKGYIPEIPWNDSCAGSLLSSHLGYPQYGSGSLCSSATASEEGLQTVTAGSGGPSGCYSGSPSTAGVVSGTCTPYGKPGWQSGFGDSVRDIPDVSLFASNGIWGHYYVVCYSDRRNGGASCSGAPSTWIGAGGTSFASPIMAGIQALVNQKTKTNWANPASTFYSLAKTVPSVFNAISTGDNVVNCSGTTDCFGATSSSSGSGHGRFGGFGGGEATANGALSTTSTGTFSPAYAAKSGYNFATGLGSINVANLLAYWP